MKTGYFMRVIIAGDMFLNVVFWGQFGETISARVGMGQTWYEDLIADGLNILQAKHVENARLHDQERSQQATKDLTRPEADI